jgi:transposase InsO family protein
LRQLSTTEQRFRAVMAVQAGARVGEVAFQFGVSRQSVHSWLTRYREGGLEALADRSHRPYSCPHQASPEVEAVVCETRRDHLRWGPVRIEYELGRNGCPGPVPSKTTVYRILLRYGLIGARKRRRGRDDFIRWQRGKPMELWQMDIVGGIILADGSEAKVVTGVDDHSRYCVIAKVVARPTGRAVCLALAEALQRFGVPEEILSDNGKQFTDRFGKGGEVLFDRICRTNGIIHRLTQPASPTTTGKIERWHQTLERELIDHCPPFRNIAHAQAVIDEFVAEYNTNRPHQSLDMQVPAALFDATASRQALQLIPLRLPASLGESVADSAAAVGLSPAAVVNELGLPVVWPAPDPQVFEAAMVSPSQAQRAIKEGRTVTGTVFDHGPVEFDRVVPPSGNLEVLSKQFWLGPARSGLLVTFWADTQVIHLTINGGRVKSVRSRLSVNDLAVLTRLGARPAGPSPLPIKAAGPVEAIETDRAVSTAGFLMLGSHIVRVNELRAGTRVGIRLDGTTLTLFDLDTRELLRSHSNPLTAAEMLKVRGARPPGRCPNRAPTRSLCSDGRPTAAASASAVRRSHLGVSTPVKP